MGKERRADNGGEVRGEPCGNCSKFKGIPDPERRQRTVAEKELKSHPQTCQGHHQRSFMRGQIKDPSKKIKDCLSPSLVAEVPWKGHDSESERWRWDENGKTWGGRATKQRGSPGPSTLCYARRGAWPGARTATGRPQGRTETSCLGQGDS